jgi:chemosensory pili system protein ChpA (sensor histidine kinase/response regulator)
VDADLLDNMLNVAGEVSIYRARLEQQVSSIDFNLAELGRVVQRLKDQLRKLEIETEAQILHRHVGFRHAPRRLRPARARPLLVDPAVLARARRDVLGRRERAGPARDADARVPEPAAQQGRIVSELQGGLMRTRMVPFQRQVQRLTRIARQAAARPARSGGPHQRRRGELDRQVLERMLAPFEHMLRNAIVHGIECRRPARRRQGRDRRHRRDAEARGLGGRHHRRR